MSFLNFLTKNKNWLGAGALLTLSSSYGQTFFISLFAGEIMEGFSLTDGQWGSVYALSTTCSAIVMVWVGALTDKYRARTLGVIFLCILAFTCFLMSFVTSFWALPILIFLLRFSGQGMLSHIGSVSMARWFVASRGKALAIATLGFSFGEAILPMTVAFFLSFLYWRSIWVAAAIVSLITIPILINLLKIERTPKSNSENAETVGRLDNRHWTRNQVLSHWLFWLYFPSIMSIAMWGTALFFQQVHLTTAKGWSLLQFTSLIPVYTCSTILAMMFYGWAIDRYGTSKLLSLYQIPMAVSFFLFGISDSLFMAGVAFALFGITHGANSTIPGAFWAENFGTKNLGSIKAMATAVSVLGSALGPAISGILIDYEIPFSKQMPFISVFVIICCFLNWVAVNKIKRVYG